MYPNSISDVALDAVVLHASRTREGHLMSQCRHSWSMMYGGIESCFEIVFVMY